MHDKRMQSSRIQTLKIMTVPVWIFSSFAIRNVVSGTLLVVCQMCRQFLAMMVLADFSPNLHGALWISNFIEPDPYFVLPVLVGVFGFLNFYVRFRSVQCFRLACSPVYSLNVSFFRRAQAQEECKFTMCFSAV